MHAVIYDYDVALSFAGEDRPYVERVASLLAERGIRVFYDRYVEAELWGKDLYEHLDDVYRNRARYCVLFASQYYATKIWTTHERKSAQARAIREHGEYVLPVRFDDTPIPGLRPTVGFVDLRRTSPGELVRMIALKLDGSGSTRSQHESIRRTNAARSGMRQLVNAEAATTSYSAGKSRGETRRPDSPIENAMPKNEQRLIMVYAVVDRRWSDVELQHALASVTFGLERNGGPSRAEVDGKTRTDGRGRTAVSVRALVSSEAGVRPFVSAVARAFGTRLRKAWWTESPAGGTPLSKHPPLDASRDLAPAPGWREVEAASGRS